MLPTNVESGHALGADGHVIGKTQSSAFDALAHSAQVQALAVYSSLEKICRAADSSLSNVARAQYFMRNARKFAGVQLAWMSRQGKQPHPFVCVQVPGALPAPGASFTADFWIYAP
jgi:enamine deaminase RidA (YjgF/YER057c/UK114 family)